MAHELGEEQRVAVALLDQVMLVDDRLSTPAANASRWSSFSASIGARPVSESLRVSIGERRRGIAGAQRREHEDRRRDAIVEQHLERGEAVVVGPLQIVDHEHDRSAVRHRREQLAQRMNARSRRSAGVCNTPTESRGPLARCVRSPTRVAAANIGTARRSGNTAISSETRAGTIAATFGSGREINQRASSWTMPSNALNATRSR